MGEITTIVQMFPPSCLKDTRHSLVKNCSMVTRDRKEPPSENSRDLFFFSVTQSCLPLCDPMDCNTPGFPILHHLLELAQIHVHWVGDAIQLSRPLLSPSPPAFNLSQHQGLFQWASSSHQVARVSELQLWKQLKVCKHGGLPRNKHYCIFRRLGPFIFR